MTMVASPSADRPLSDLGEVPRGAPGHSAITCNASRDTAWAQDNPTQDTHGATLCSSNPRVTRVRRTHRLCAPVAPLGKIHRAQRGTANNSSSGVHCRFTNGIALRRWLYAGPTIARAALGWLRQKGFWNPETQCQKSACCPLEGQLLMPDGASEKRTATQQSCA